MGRIKLLSETLASQVAAGEVVERPASVVKELVENSIDAGARSIEVRVRRGGISLIRVVDDGCGMERDDALLALERHATSKIASAADLASVSTLGFRGEALPSIASVSRFRLTTREPAAVAGTEIVVNGGRIETVREGGEAPGTQIEVRSLFYNVPGRRKFLRAEATEERNVEHQFSLQALANSGIGFTLLRNDKLARQLPAVATLRDRIRDLYGPALLSDLLEVVPNDKRTVRVGGWIGRAGLARQTRTQQFVFVNGRAIESGAVSAALREGFHTPLMRGQYPVTFLFLSLGPKEVDVNVHPAKREVRFREPTKVREAVVEAIQRTLASARGDWQQQFQPPVPAVTGGMNVPPPVSFAAVQSFFVRPPSPGEMEAMDVNDLSKSRHRFGGDIQTNAPAEPESSARGHKRERQNFQIIGVLNKLYVLMENAEGLVLVDQHAAHERILFEELRRRMEEQGVPSQRMLLPQVFAVPSRDGEWIERNAPTLEKMGIHLEQFGRDSFRLESLPAFLKVSDAASFLREIIDELRATSRSTSALRLGEEMIAKTVCRHAVKANDPLSFLEVEKLIRDLLACDLPYCCPHGRPTMIQISHAELEKKFGRKV